MSVTYTPRTETVVILQGNDDERLRQLRAFATDLRAKADRLRPRGDPKAAAAPMGEAGGWSEANANATEAEQVADDFAATAAENGITVVLCSVGRSKWRELVAAHPAREGNEDDKLDTLADDLVPACMGSPVFGSDDERAAFLDSLSEAEFGRLAQVAWLLNTRTSADPNLRVGLRLTPT